MKRTLIMFGLIIAANSLLAKAQYGPIIENYGPVYQVSSQETILPKDFKYKVIFDVSQTASDTADYSRRLESVARFINMHAMKGVSLKDMDIAVVFHGKATKDILTDESYQKKYQTNNPNRELIEVLADTGVKMFICGQTADFNMYQRKDILPEIKIALSAMTQLAIYQANGYALLP